MVGGALVLRFGLLGVIITLVGTATAVGSTGGQSYDCKTLAGARAGVATEHPGIMLPTRLPPMGFVCPAPYVIPGMVPAYFATFTKGKATNVGGHLLCRCDGGWVAQLNVWRGHVKAKVVRILLSKDGTSGSAVPFTAGRYTGTLELQKHAALSPSEGFVWEAGQFTYLFGVRGSRVPTPGFVPRTIIASFRAP